MTGLSIIGSSIIVFLAALFYAVIKWAYSIGFGTREAHKDAEKKIPLIEQCQMFRDRMEEDADEIMNEPCERISIMSKDGLRLSARLYEWEARQPVIIAFHGYRSTPVRDCAPIFKIAKKMGCRLILVDQRTHGNSEGETIAMGIKERHDCKLWAEYAVERFGEKTEIVLAGYSMGASTILMAAGLHLPKQVKGILADCGYSDVKTIVTFVGDRMRFPFGIKIQGRWSYPFARLGARIFGNFDPEETSPKDILKKCTIPILFIHGEKDGLVPVWMGQENYEACASEKEMLLIPKADHCMSYYMDTKKYVEKVVCFLQKYTDI